ncbi:TIGR03016 family PEP-CTERM system-associated outer membrane protein [Roseateles sp. DB2]|uniref:TIGR03016 family PEP-CTERM system-associated outer membrane protein n=1 Tax=Roseateles sp. DB2 TaxID=3453717 RepID=UPI003EEBAABD
MSSKTLERSWPLLVGVCMASGLLGAAAAQESGDGPGAAGHRLIALEPRVLLSQGYTSNLKLSSHSPDAALVTTLAPGLSLRARGHELNGNLDYSLNGSYYQKSAEPDRIYHRLSSQLRWAPTDGSMFVQAVAGISQQNLSVLGPRSVDPNLPNPNSTQVANLSVMPGLRLRLGGAAVLESQVNFTLTRAKDTNLGDQSGYAAGAVLKPARAGAQLGWQVMADVQASQPRAGRRVASDRLIGMLSYRPDPDWQAGVNLGTDANNYTSEGKERKAAYGFQLAWKPSPRTSADLAADRRSYGSTHSLAVEYRWPRLALRFSDIQQIAPPGVQGGLGTRTNYDLLFQMLASLEPDAEKRRELVLATLKASGLSPDAVSAPGFLSSAVSLSRSRQVAALWQGPRTTVSLSLAHTSNQRLGAVSIPGDDLGLGERISQKGGVLAMSHRLTSMSTLSLGYTDQRTHTEQGLVSSTHLRTWSAALSMRLPQSRTLSFSVRRAEMESPLQPYVENAVTGTLQQLF